ncbi:MAG: DUF2306 domain-containing protein [Cyclobacteriaceae bacterium]
MGQIHLLSAMGAMVAGTIVLTLTKGNRVHKTWGYVYVLMMTVLNGSAFFLYKLTGTWGPFHLAAIISLATISAAMVPVLSHRHSPQRIYRHMAFMYYSVVGLYAAFFAELFSRLWPAHFVIMVMAATAATLAIGFGMFNTFRKRWIMLK